MDAGEDHFPPSFINTGHTFKVNGYKLKLLFEGFRAQIEKDVWLTEHSDAA